jgi:hypothetical protein
VEIRGTDTRAADRTIAEVAQAGIYRTDDHLLKLRAEPATGRDPEAIVRAHVRRLEALRRGGVVERLNAGVWKIPADLPDQGRAFDRERLGGASITVKCHLAIERQTRIVGATWLDQELIKGTTNWPNNEFGSQIRDSLKKREQFLVDQGLARTFNSRVVPVPNLLGTLRDRELADAVTRMTEKTHLPHRPTLDGVAVSGVYRESIQLSSGRFAMLDDGVGFALVPWRPVIEKRLGQELSVVMDGGRVNWELGRSRSISI